MTRINQLHNGVLRLIALGGRCGVWVRGARPRSGHPTAGCHPVLHGESQASVDHRATVAADVRRNEPVIRDAVAVLSSLDEVIRPLDI